MLEILVGGFVLHSDSFHTLFNAIIGAGKIIHELTTADKDKKSIEFAFGFVVVKKSEQEINAIKTAILEHRENAVGLLKSFQMQDLKNYVIQDHEAKTYLETLDEIQVTENSSIKSKNHPNSKPKILKGKSLNFLSRNFR